MKLNKREQKLYDFMRQNETGLDEVIDLVIKSNGIIGVGLVTLEESCKRTIDKHYYNYKNRSDEANKS